MLHLPRSQSIMPEINQWTSTPGTSTHGITVTGSGSVNTKGSWTQMFAAATVTYDVFGISLIINNNATNATVTKQLFDIGIGGAGSEVVAVPNILFVGNVSSRSVPWRELFLPIFIPRNTRISCRTQSNVVSKTASVMMHLHGGGALAPTPAFSNCDSYGTDTSTSGAVSLTPGSSGTYSSWTNVGATLTRDYHALVPQVSTGSNTAMTNMASYFQVGINSTNLRHYMATFGSGEDVGFVYPVQPMYGHFASGTQLQIRATDHTTGENKEWGFLAFY